MSVCFKIVDFNYCFQDEVDILASSQSAEFPSENLRHEFRSKSWRSKGNFILTALNNKIDFKETGGGPEITATVPVGTYTSLTLSAAIKAAMESVTLNARTYTVSWSGQTGKWTILGSTYLDILFSTGTSAATSIRSVIGFGASDFTGAITYTGPLIAIHTEESVVFDLQTTESIDIFAMLFDPEIGVKFSDTAVLTLEANATNSWAAPAYSQVLGIDLTYDHATVFMVAPESYRFWRIKIVDPQNPYLYVEIGSVVLGLNSDIGRCPDNGFDLTWDDGSTAEKTKYGNTYVDEFPIAGRLAFNFNVMDYTSVKALEAIFLRVGNKVPIFVSLDSTETLFDKDHFAMIGRMQDKFGLKHIKRDYFAASIVIEESL